MPAKVEDVDGKGATHGFDLDQLVGTDSLSKGVFGFRGKRSAVASEYNENSDIKRTKKSKNLKKTKKKGKKDKQTVNCEEDLDMFSSGNDVSMTEQYALFKSMWCKVLDVYTKVLQENFAEIIAKVGDFVDNCGISNEILDSDEGDFEIPTACILSGINVPDHADLFHQLKASLTQVDRPEKNDSTSGSAVMRPFTASIKSKDCSATNMRSLLKVALAQIVRSSGSVGGGSQSDVNGDGDSSDSDDGENQDAASKIARKMSLTGLRAWYRNQVPETADKKPPLVIILEDFEGFQPSVLQDFIHNLRLVKLPVVLVFGVATTVDAVHRSLPHAVTSSLAIRKFASAPSATMLAQLVRTLTMSPDIPFKLGGEVMKTLLETFMFHDFSVKHFLLSYKFCMLEHFLHCKGAGILGFSNEMLPLSKSRQQGGEEGVGLKTRIKDLNINVLEYVRKLPSVKRYEDENGQVVDIGSFLFEHLPLTWTSISNFNLFVDCLCRMSSTEFFPRHTLGKFYHSVYTLAMQESIYASADYRDLFKFMNFMEKTALERQLQTMISCLNKSPLPMAQEASATAKQFVKEINAIDVASPAQSRKDDTLKSPPTTPSSGQKKKLDRFQLKESLLAQAREAKASKQSPYDRLRARVTDFYHQTFKKALASPIGQQLVLQELFIFNDSQTVTTRLQGTPRTALQKALQAPHFYIEDDNVRIEDLGEIPSSLPDLAITYKLHLECGRYINLVDWFQCWLSIVEKRDCEEDEASPVDPRLHARFNRSVSELQFLGFIRPSKRKTDHVERLTWNS